MLVGVSGKPRGPPLNLVALKSVMSGMDLLQIEGSSKPRQFGEVVFDAAVSFFRFQMLLLVSALEWFWRWGWRWCWCRPWFGFVSGVGVGVGGTWNLHPRPIN